MTNAVSLVVNFQAKVGMADELGKRLKALVEPTHREEGCIDYILYQDRDDAGHWMFYETWRSQADLDTHLQMPYLQEFIAHRHEVLEGDWDIRFYNRIEKIPASV